LSLAQAAALPETFFTVWVNLFQRAGLKSGESVLVHGGASGIGTTAIQLARAFGATVFTTAGSPERCDRCVALGASRAIDYRTEDFVAVVKNETAKRGVDVILDIIGGDYLPRNIDCLAMDGRLAQIGLIGGSRAAFDFRPVLQKRLSITGSTLRARTVEEKGAIARELEARVWPLLAQGSVTPIVDAEFPLDRAADAHRALESGLVFGKAVLVV
jgi:putative PIG3 family NAD(P)H quinone oxidoreductase